MQSETNDMVEFLAKALFEIIEQEVKQKPSTVIEGFH